MLSFETWRRSRNLDFPYWRYAEFDFDKLNEDECIANFRFKKNDIYVLKELFQIPDEVVCYNRWKLDGIEALCIYLERYAYQRILYNGHKRVHSIKFQSIVIPNGLKTNLFRPVEGKRHDAAMLAQSGLLGQLQQHSHATDGRILCIYGDPAYPLRRQLQAPFKGPRLTAQQTDFNKSMTKVRVSVEWVFGDIANFFKFIDFKKNLKVRLSAVGKMYLVCALLQNCRTCLYGNITSGYFDCDPPNINTYLA